MAATFRIAVDSADVRQGLGVFRAEAGKAVRAVVGEQQRASRDAQRALDEERRAAVRTANDSRRAAEQAARAKVRAEEQAARQLERIGAGLGRFRARAEELATRKAAQEGQARARGEANEASERTRLAAVFYESKKRAEAQATAQAATEAARRTAIEERATAARERLAERAARSAQRAERAAGRATERTNARRVREGRASGREFAGQAYDAVTGAASQLYGQQQDVRMRRAESEHTINSALFQAGASRDGNTAALRQRMYAWAQHNGVDSGELASAANQAQTEFSVFGDSHTTDAERGQRVEQFLGNADLARSTYQDVGQVTRLAGMLQNAGIRGPAQHNALLAMTGFAQRGAIELGGITSTAMAPIQQAMANASARLGPGAAPEAVQHAQQQAILQTMAEMEVGRSQGINPRRLGNVTAQLDRSLTAPATQANMLRNLQHAGRADVIGALYDHGHLRERYTTSLGLAAGLQTAFHGDTTAMNNTFAGTGAGNAQSLRQNQREILATFMSGGPEIQRMLAGAGTDFTDADAARGKQMVDSEQRTQLQAVQEQHDNELGDNTGAITGLTNTIHDWMGKNPVAATVGGAAAAPIVRGAVRGGGGLLGEIVGGAGRGVSSGLGGVVRTVASQVGLVADLLHPGNQDMRGHTDYFDDAAAIRAHRGGASAQSASAAATVTNMNSEQARALQGIHTWIAQGSPVRATLDERGTQQVAAAARGAPSGETHETHR